MADQKQEYTVSHTGGTLGSSKVTTAGNQTAPQRETAIISFECPRKFSEIEYVGQRDSTRFVPRTTESITGTAGDDTVVSLTANIQPVAGETAIEDQDYPVAVAYNVTQGVQVDIEDVDYAADEVTLASNPADGDEVKVWSIMGDGDVQFRLVNQFGQEEGRVYPWATPLYRWHDFPQLKRGREINLHGSVTWEENETVEVLLDAPQEITWEDADYPEGQYVSTFEQDVEITL
ncbi:head protein [Haloarcula hispanica virus PH1]|uniref:Capsid protein VP4 n=1 Tax=Haloarcula hispanica virus PH1 TaxID=1282967 RepID=M4JFL8_9VIRU|nr:head protein [Haloarcula hispanica virus PH1]AGC65546.1 capsid protein VP4 [Haloarcula hispanica virus PH1]